MFPMASAALASQKSKKDRDSGKHCCLLPMCAILITCMACRPTDQHMLKYKHTHLPCCRELECESYCSPHTGRVISQVWLIRVSS